MRTNAIVIACMSVFLAAFAHAQSPIVGPQIRLDPLEEPVGNFDPYGLEFAAASRGSEAVGVWMTRPQDFDGGNLSIRMFIIAKTSDAGVTWELESYHFGGPGAPEHDPFTAYDAMNGDIWVGGGNSSDAFMKRLAVGAEDWDREMSWDDGGHTWEAASGPHPTDPNTRRLYVVQNSATAWTDDRGVSWSDPVAIPLFPGFYQCLVVGDGGEFYVTGKGVLPDASELFLTRSLSVNAAGEPTDFERITFDPTSDADLVRNDRYPGDFFSATFPSMVVDPTDGKRVFITYPKVTSVQSSEHNIDLYLIWTNDVTADVINWNGPSIIPDGIEVPGDQLTPALAMDNHGRLHLLYMDSQNTLGQVDGSESGFYDFYYAISSDDGANWKQFRLTPTSFDVDDKGDTGSEGGAEMFGAYHVITAAGNRVYPFYPDTSPGFAEAHTNLIVIGDLSALGGWLINKGTLLPGGFDPLAMSDDQRLHILSESDAGQTTEVIFDATSPYDYDDSEEIDILIELHASVGLVEGELFVKNWLSTAFDLMSTFRVPTSDDVIEERGLDAATYVRASDGRIEVKVWQHLDSPAQFISRYDHLQIVATKIVATKR